MNRIVSALLVGLAITPFLTGIARAQIDYDAAKHAYFVTGDATINTDVRGNDVFVGKDNATDFNTLPGPITLTVADGANIIGHGNVYADGNSYQGLNVFGANTASISGGRVDYVNGFQTSSVNVSGGYVLNVIGYETSSVNLSGGEITALFGAGTSSVNISGGTVSGNVSGSGSSSVNISGGALDRVIGRGPGSVGISGGTVNLVEGHYASSVSISGGNIGGIDNDISDGKFIGIFGLSGTLNLYGIAFARTGIIAGPIVTTLKATQEPTPP